MKKIIFALLILISIGGKAQNVKQTKEGNYIATTQNKGDTASKKTGKTYTDAKGKVYPVYVSKNGKLFIKKVSAKGNEYKMYLKTN